MCLSVLLSVCLSLGAAQTKQTAVFMKPGRATRVFCLVVHFSTHTYAHMHTRRIPGAPHLLPALFCCIFAPLCFLPGSVSLSPSLSFSWPPLLSVMLACSLSDREECHSVWPLTYNKEGCRFWQGSEGAAAVMCPGVEGNTHRHMHIGWGC